tara:strand:+ start:356 stop:496 length:141 start_codon:yes stop_codon:yes gene_type:complete
MARECSLPLGYLSFWSGGKKRGDHGKWKPKRSQREAQAKEELNQSP